MAGFHTPSDISDADMKTCVLIGGHLLIQSIWKSHGCQVFRDLARVFKQITTHYFGTWLNQSSGSIKQKPVHKLIEGTLAPLPWVCNTFIALDENKVYFARFLWDVITIKGKDLPEQYQCYTCKVNEKRSTRDALELHAIHANYKQRSSCKQAKNT